MNYTEHKITLEIHRAVSPVTISVKKGDTGRRLLIHLAERGRPYRISNDCYAVFTAKKPDGNVIFNNCSIKDSAIVYDLTDQTVAAVGLVDCEIILYGAGGKQLTSASFQIIVEDTIYDTETEIESASEYNALADLIAQANTVVVKGLAAPPIIEEATGEVINISDASDKGLHGLRIFGKSTQAAVPTLDSPVEIVSLGEAGEIIACVSGRNLLDTSTITNISKNTAIEITDSGKAIKYNATGETGTFANVEMAMTPHIAGRKIYVTYNKKTTNKTDTTGYLQIKYFVDGVRYYIENSTLKEGAVKIPAEAYDIRFAIYFQNSNVAIESGTWVQYDGLRVSLAEGSVWEPYKEIQALPISTANGLAGIPVDSGGNYIDSNGQQWICDEVDLARGVYVQRIGTVTSTKINLGTVKLNDKSTNYNQFTITVSSLLSAGTASAINAYKAICNRLPLGSQINAATSKESFWIFERFTIVLVLNNVDFPDVESVSAWLADNDVEIKYILRDPIETELTAEEIAAFATLHTYGPYTTIYSDVGAGIATAYVADTKIYVKSKTTPAAVIAEVTLLADAWVGADSLYSQVVQIDGITDNSQVNLTPSVEQLAIFYEKDLTFVTENDGGVVTVYVIGQKPQNDYTIPANIVEVIA